MMFKVLKNGAVVKSLSLLVPMLLATACAQVEVPDPRAPDVPSAIRPLDRMKGVNEDRSSITRIPLGKDVLVPKTLDQDPLPDVQVGPFELRNETLASALQLVLDEYDVSIAFESNLGLTRRITVANLHGRLDKVVNRLCSLADLYCHYEHGVMTIKETQTFIVDLPPLSTSSEESGTGGEGETTTTGGTDEGGNEAYDQIADALEAIVGTEPTIDETTRTLIYTASQRDHKYAEQLFQRMRKNTALIVFETHVWEVSLNNENRTGINWEGLLTDLGNFNVDFDVTGAAAAGDAAPITITPTFTGSANLTSEAVLQFISSQGAVKTVSQPQLTVLSGASATMTVEQNENFVSQLTRTVDPDGDDSISTTTDTVTTGLSMSVTSAWDRSTVYGRLNIELQELLEIEDFSPGPDNLIQLPRTTSRTLQTQIRVRPGDAVLIGGMVTERDNFNTSGPGLLKPLFSTSRGAITQNTELVFLLRPRVIAYVDDPQLAKEMQAREEMRSSATAETYSSSAKAPLGGIPAGAFAPVGNELADAPVEREVMPTVEIPAPAQPAPATPPVTPVQRPAVSESRQPVPLSLPSWLPSQSSGSEGGQQ